MYIVAQHRISDPARFWSVNPQGPPGAPSLQASFRSVDGTEAICLWESDSIETVRNHIDELAGDSAENTYFEVDPAFALGLPERATAKV